MNAARTLAIVLLVALLGAGVSGSADAQRRKVQVKPEPQLISCEDGWCLVREETMRELVTGVKKMNDHVQELRVMCGWEPK